MCIRHEWIEFTNDSNKLYKVCPKCGKIRKLSFAGFWHSADPNLLVIRKAIKTIREWKLAKLEMSRVLKLKERI